MNVTSVQFIYETDANSAFTTADYLYEDLSRGQMIARYEKIAENLSIITFYAMIAESVIGLIGNSASLAIWVAGKRSSTLASTTYFIFLSATDIFSLVYRLLDALGRPPVEAGYMDYDVVCFIDAFLFFFAPQLSTWIVVCLTIERTLSLCFPLKFQTKGSGRRAKIAFVSILFLLTSVNCVRPMLCTSDSKLLFDIYTEIMKLSGIYLLCVIPLVTITTCNIIVICKLCMHKTIGASDSRRNVASKFTRISLGAGVLQCVSIIPALFYNIEVYHKVQLLPEKYEDRLLFQYVTDIALYLNNTFNFVVYSFSSRDFRRDFKEMFSCKH